MFGWLKRRREPTLADELRALLARPEEDRPRPDLAAIERRLAADPRLANAGGPLIPAVRLGSLPLVRLLLRAKADPQVRAERRMTLLHLAAEDGHVEIGRLLLEAGVPVDAIDRYRRTPLIVAAGYGQEAMALMLLEQGADLLAGDIVGERAVDWAIFNRHFDVARALLIAAGRDGPPTWGTSDVDLAVLAREDARARELVLARRGIRG